MTKRLVIFDCVGVLFRSDLANVAFYNEVLRRLSEPPLGVPGEAACHRLASAQFLESLFAHRRDLLDRALVIANSLDYTPFYELMTPREDLYDVLAALRKRYRLAMATNRGKTASGVVSHFTLHPYLELTVGVLDVARPKPHPDMLDRCVSHFGLLAEEALYVGDQQIDADAARAAGLSFVAMGPVVAEAEYRVDALSELVRLIPSL
jgi:HAD superfamily hydrolase (TIGR01509 family)